MTPPLCCETQKETFSEVTTAFDDKFTAPREPMLLDLTGSNYRFGRCLLFVPLSQSQHLSVDLSHCFCMYFSISIFLCFFVFLFSSLFLYVSVSQLISLFLHRSVNQSISVLMSLTVWLSLPMKFWSIDRI